MDLGVIGGNVMGVAYTYANMALMFVGVLLFVVGISVLAYKMKKGEWFGKYPVKVRIWEIRGKMPRLASLDGARATKDAQGAWLYELKKKKVVIKAIPYRFINPDNSLDLLALGRDEYHPIQLMIETATVTNPDGSTRDVEIPKLKPVIDESYAIAYTYRIHKNYLRKPNNDFWEKYGGLVTILTVGMLVLLMIIVVLREMGSITASLASVASAYSTATAAMANCGGAAAVAVAP